MTPPVALRLALRDLRGGLSHFWVLLGCLALSVAAIAAVGSVRAAIESGLSREAAALLGGDAEVEFTYRFADDAERQWMAQAAAEVSEIVDFRSMAAVRPGGEDELRLLVRVKAVDAAYPLFGTVDLAGGTPLAAALAETEGLPGLVAESTLIDRLGLVPGDTVRLGTRDFRLAGTLVGEPDPASGGLAFGPRVIVRLADLETSGLLATGSMFDSSYRLRLPPDADLAALQADAEGRFRDTGLQWRDRRDGAPGIGRFVDRLGDFLVLVGLAGLAVGGIGVSASVRAHLDSRTGTIATLKTLGATGGTIFAVYFLQIGLLALAGIVLGLVAGAVLALAALPLAAAFLPVPATFGLYPGPLAEAASYGALSALIFTVWPLARAHDIRAARLFRDIAAPDRVWPRPAYLAVTVALAAALVGLATLFSGAPDLALGTALGVVVALALLALAARGLSALARRAARSRLPTGRPALRWALGALGGPSGETTSAVLSLGLGLSVLAAVGQIDRNLRDLVARDLPDRAPAFFFIDIQNDQLDGFLADAGSVSGIAEIETAPMLRGIITRINDRPAEEAAGPHWVLRGDRGVTYAARPPEGTTITEGDWWPEDYAGPPLVSFAAEEGRELGLRIGDTLTINILGRDMTATIANFREVRFETMGINFLIILDPDALAGAPHTHIATIHATPEAEAPLLRAVADEFPNATAIRVRDAIDRVSAALEQVGAATRWAAAVTLATGFMVLIAAAAAGERRRVFEAAVLKTLGAGRLRILLSFGVRAALTGAAAGVVAIAVGAGAGWWVTTRILEGSFRFAPGLAVAIVAGGALLSLLAGLGFALRPLAARPARVLRTGE